MAQEEFETRRRDAERRRSQTELVLPEGESAYIQDTVKGVTVTKVGPTVVTLQGQERPVLYNHRTGRFDTVTLGEAAQVNTIVPKGHYCVLQNPTDQHPTKSNSGEGPPPLQIGQRKHISGPATFALWPRQVAKVIEGHQLRLNQYLLVRVYDEEAAKENWSKAVVQKAISETDTGMVVSEDQTAVVVSDDVPEDLSVGRLLVIQGTDVSFYIPPTGIEVLADDNGNYVREALTLERLQYCILIDEDGNKRYLRGPVVVFPKPTERFHTNQRGERAFRPIELNGPIQGIHVKVIASYTDKEGLHGKKGATYKEGDELFITGDTCAIYFPCEQHSAVKYDGRTKHFATAIPAGDARYVLDRHTGVIKMVKGGDKGTMYLPDPRKEVFVRRALTDSECSLMYPENNEVQTYNRTLRSLQKQAPTTRKGVVSEGELARSRKRGGPAEEVLLYAASSMSVGDTEFADSYRAGGTHTAEMGGDEFSRKATYTEPRTVTLGSDKFAGVPVIQPWTGFAVMIVDSAGNRRVEIGPKRVLLGFDETVERLTLSRGKPKTTDNLLHTAYLRVKSNRVSDVIKVQTADHVTVRVKVALRVDFENTGDTDNTRWFEAQNYVKLLCDHVRSVLKAAVRSQTIEAFNAQSEIFIRDTILGAKDENGNRTGMVFEENLMKVYDVEVLEVVITDDQIQAMLLQAQHEAVSSNITLQQSKRRLEVLVEQEKIKQQEAAARAKTAEHKAELTAEEIKRGLQLSLLQTETEIEQLNKQLERQQASDTVADTKTKAALGRQKAADDARMAIEQAKQELKLAFLSEETEAAVKRFQAADGKLAEALLALGNQETMIKMAEAVGIGNFLGGRTLPETLAKVFEGTPLMALMESVQNKATKGGNGDISSSRVKSR